MNTEINNIVQKAQSKEEKILLLLMLAEIAWNQGSIQEYSEIIEVCSQLHPELKNKNNLRHLINRRVNKDKLPDIDLD